MSDDRSYPSRPICGVGVVAFRDNEVVLIRRGKEPRRGEWSIPGGAVELGEGVRDAALREFQEECGGKIRLRDIVDAVDIISRDAQERVAYHYMVVDFWADWETGAITPASDVMEARWVPLQELDVYQLPPWTREVIEKAVLIRRRG